MPFLFSFYSGNDQMRNSFIETFSLFFPVSPSSFVQPITKKLIWTVASFHKHTLKYDMNIKCVHVTLTFAVPFVQSTEWSTRNIIKQKASTENHNNECHSSNVQINFWVFFSFEHIAMASQQTFHVYQRRVIKCPFYCHYWNELNSKQIKYRITN